jgi:hypothetical protein
MGTVGQLRRRLLAVMRAALELKTSNIVNVCVWGIHSGRKQIIIECSADSKFAASLVPF